MRVLIQGCSQLTTLLVPDLARAGSQVTVLSRNRDCLEVLADEPHVEVVLITELLMQDYLRMGGIDNADIFLALSRDDPHTALVAQLALHIFNVPRVICYLEHPQLRILYAGLGLDVVGSTLGLVQDIRQAIER